MSTRSLVSVNPGIERSALKHDLDPREFFVSRSGDVATLRPMSNTAQIVPGMTAFFGLYANRPADSPLPSGFTFSSAATGAIGCAVSG